MPPRSRALANYFEKQFEENKKWEEAKLDASVLARVRTLPAKLTWYHHRYDALNVLAMLGASPLTGPQLLPWADATVPGLANRLNQMHPAICGSKGPTTMMSLIDLVVRVR